MSITIEQILDKYKAKDENALLRSVHQSQLDYQLELDLKKVQDAFPGIKFMIYLIENVYHTRITLDNVINTYKSYNIITYEDYKAWDEALKVINIDKICQELRPIPPEISAFQMKTISNTELKSFILNMIPHEYQETNLSSKFNFGDGEYRIPTKEDIYKIIEYSDVDKLTYIKNARDCEDFSALFKCDLRRLGLGDLTVTKNLEVNLYKRKDDNGFFSDLYAAHSINLLIYLDDEGNKVMKLYEPQTDAVFNVGDIIINTKYYKVRFIEF